MKKQSPTKIRFLVTGTVQYLLDDSKEILSTTLNTILQVPNHYISAYDIGRAQQALQMQLDSDFKNEHKITPIRVVVDCFSLLGEMTDEQWNFRPDAAKPAQH